MNVLADTQQHISTRFSTACDDRWSGIEIERGYEGARLIGGAAASFQCKPHSQHSTGDHTLFIVDVVDLRINAALTPLVFCKGRYQALKMA